MTRFYLRLLLAGSHPVVYPPSVPFLTGGLIIPILERPKPNFSSQEACVGPKELLQPSQVAHFLSVMNHIGLIS